MTKMHQKGRDIAKEWEELAKKNGFKKSDLIYGDKLYEEVFGSQIIKKQRKHNNA